SPPVLSAAGPIPDRDHDRAVAHQHAVPPRPSDPRGGEQQQLPALRSQPQHGWGHRYAKEPDDGEAVGASRSGGPVADHPAGDPAMTPRQTPRLNARSHWYRWLLRADRERPRHGRATEQREELAAFQLIELHPVPASQGRITGYRIASDQSAGNGR